MRLPSLLERLIAPQSGDLLPEHAKYVLSLGFSDAEQERCHELSYKAQDGALNSDEQTELDDFLTASALLMILQSKARKSLNTDPSTSAA